MWGSSGQPSEQHRLGRPVHALAAVIAILAFLVFSCPALASSAPTIERESVSGLTEHDATLEAQINTGGVATRYHFRLEYGCDLSGDEACPQFCIVPGPCPGPVNGPVDIPLPSGVLPGSSQVEHVSLDLHEIGVTLEPDTKYRYSIEATNTTGTAESPGQIFTTLSAQSGGTAPPTEVVTEPAEVIPGGAKLKGGLNPGGLPTTYYFEYLGDNAVECLAGENCWPETAHAGPITGDSEQQVPPIEVTGLRMGETYRYRLVASNADGTVQSKVATFTVGFSPVITSLEPAHGPTSGGTTVTIHGEPLENVRSVHFGTVEGKILHEECDDECEIMPYRTLVVESPPHAAGTVDVTVETAQGVSVASPGDKFTYGSSGAPTIDSESVSKITEHDATLEAQINTEGLETSYQFHLWAVCGGKGACQVVINYPLPSGNLLGSFVDQSVSLDLNTAGVTLQPGGQYFYSVTATSAGGTAGTAEGSRSFITPEPVVQPLNTTTSPQPGVGQFPASASGDQSAGSGGSGSGGSSSSTPGMHSPGTGLGKTIKLEPLTNAEKLAKALKQCKKEPKRKRAACEKQAHQKYASVAEKSRKG
jgi:hypothetical protein